MATQAQLLKIHNLIALAFGTTFEEEARTSALNALLLMKKYGLLQDLMALGEAVRKAAQKPKKKRYKSSHFASVGGRHGGAARAKALTPEQLSEIARKGAQARWGKRHQKLPSES